MSRKAMQLNVILVLIFFIPEKLVAGLQIPSISNITLVPLSAANQTMIYNRTCFECVCETMPNNAALNCFSNNTCEVFQTVPYRYKLVENSESKLYFPNGQLPEPSRCCMSNFTEVLQKFDSAVRINVSLPSPRCLLLDNHGHLVVSNSNPSFLRKFNATSLQSINQLTINVTSSAPFDVAQQNNAYYVALGGPSQLAVLTDTTSPTMSIINSPHFSKLRNIIFLHDGEIMVVTSSSNASIIFLQRSSSVSSNYSFKYAQPVSYGSPHGLVYVNDSFFYTTSYQLNSIYSYTATNQSYWRENLVLDARPWKTASNGNHFAIDECGRTWFALGSAGILIFDTDYQYLGHINASIYYVFDILITENYIVYITEISQNYVIRIDPNIQC